MAGPVRIAFARIADLAPRLPATRRGLSAADRRRYVRMRSAKRRREFLAGRCLLGMMGSPAGAASLSHAGGWVACAVAPAQRIGVDLEPAVARDFAAGGSWAFGRPAASLGEFYDRWTAYEARLKAGRDGVAGFRQATYHVRGGLTITVCAPGRCALPRPRRWRNGAFHGEPG